MGRGVSLIDVIPYGSDCGPVSRGELKTPDCDSAHSYPSHEAVDHFHLHKEDIDGDVIRQTVESHCNFNNQVDKVSQLWKINMVLLAPYAIQQAFVGKRCGSLGQAPLRRITENLSPEIS